MTGETTAGTAVESDPSADTVAAVFDAVAALVPEIRAGLADRREPIDAENPSGETQLAADAWTDSLFADRLGDVEGVGAYASEEREAVTDCGTGLAVAVDPLDGSSNLPSNNPVGTVVGVYDATLPAPGRDLVAAGYVLYGPVTTMTVARERGATRDEDAADTGPVVDTDRVVDGVRETVDADVSLPGDPTVYGFGGGPDAWTEPFARFAEEAVSELKCRYSGALVADVNQVLTYGGLFAYPALSSRPSGKLRTLFEAAPIAYVVEAAGGRSSDGRQSLLDREPTGLHDRTPVHLGSPGYVDRLEASVSRGDTR